MDQIDMDHDMAMRRGRTREPEMIARHRWRVGRSLVALLACASCVLPGAGLRLPGAQTVLASSATGPLSAVQPRQLLVEPDDGDRALIRSFDAAQRQIFVECYIVSDHTVAHALERAAAQGVRVYVMLEPHAFGLGLQPQRMRTELQAAGIRFRWTPANFALTHAKFAVIDDTAAWIATANFSRAGFHGNREFLVELSDPAVVRNLSNIFRSDWDRLPIRSTAQPLVIAPENARATFGHLINSAHRSLLLYAEEVQDPAFERWLMAAVTRHVDVRLILAWGSTPAAAQLLARAGVKLRELNRPYIHAKVFLIDGKLAFLGSENPSTQSLDQNREVGILVDGPGLMRIIDAFGLDWARAVPFRA